MEVQNTGIFEDVVVKSKPLPTIKETCILEPQASAEELIRLNLTLSVKSSPSWEIDIKVQALDLKTNWLTYSNKTLSLFIFDF